MNFTKTLLIIVSACLLSLSSSAKLTPDFSHLEEADQRVSILMDHQGNLLCYTADQVFELPLSRCDHREKAMASNLLSGQSELAGVGVALGLTAASGCVTGVVTELVSEWRDNSLINWLVGVGSFLAVSGNTNPFVGAVFSGPYLACLGATHSIFSVDAEDIDAQDLFENH